MNISGVLVLAKPICLDSVNAALCTLEGVEVHATTPEGRMVVTIENPSMQETVKNMEEIQFIDGVLSVSMVYNQFDDTDDELSVNPSCGAKALLPVVVQE